MRTADRGVILLFGSEERSVDGYSMDVPPVTEVTTTLCAPIPT